MPDSLPLVKWLLSTEHSVESEVNIMLAAARMTMTAPPDPLPPAEVTTTTDYQKVSVKVRRDGARERTYEGNGPNEGDRVTDVIKKIFDDPATPEYVRRG